MKVHPVRIIKFWLKHDTANFNYVKYQCLSFIRIIFWHRVCTKFFVAVIKYVVNLDAFPPTWVLTWCYVSGISCSLFANVHMITVIVQYSLTSWSIMWLQSNICHSKSAVPHLMAEHLLFGYGWNNDGEGSKNTAEYSADRDCINQWVQPHKASI